VSALAILLPMIAVILMFYFSFAPWTIILLAISVVIPLAFKTQLHTLRNLARRDVDYDEFGRSKRKGFYENLSQKERDEIDLMNTAHMEQIVSTSALKKMTKPGSKNPEKDLNDLVGMQGVKEKVLEMSARMEFEASRDKKHKLDNKDEITTRHMVFYGNPGTGKTTFARIIAGFLYKNHFIEKNKCLEVDGNFLKAGTDTAVKTEWLIRESFGGVLFIDEAYALLGSEEGDAAVATLIKQMEDNRGRFVLILAGYTDEMKALLNANPGFKSRIKEYLYFPDYSNEEMFDIFQKFAHENNMVVSAEARDAFYVRLKDERKRSSFGNGRTARNILSESIDKHAYNLKTGKIEPGMKYMLLDIDIPTKRNQNTF
jgi:stage V sporulation protein K